MEALEPGVGVEGDLFADALEDFLGGVVEAGAEEEVVGGRLDVDVVAGHAGFLATGADVDAAPVLVGALVGGEADVAVDAVGAVFYL